MASVSVSESRPVVVDRLGTFWRLALCGVIFVCLTLGVGCAADAQRDSVPIEPPDTPSGNSTFWDNSSP